VGDLRSPPVSSCIVSLLGTSWLSLGAQRQHCSRMCEGRIVENDNMLFHSSVPVLQTLCTPPSRHTNLVMDRLWPAAAICRAPQPRYIIPQSSSSACLSPPNDPPPARMPEIKFGGGSGGSGTLGGVSRGNTGLKPSSGRRRKHKEPVQASRDVVGRHRVRQERQRPVVPVPTVQSASLFLFPYLFVRVVCS